MMENILGIFNEITGKKRVFILSFFYMFAAFIISFLFFKGIIPKDRISWIFWIVSIFLLLNSVYQKYKYENADDFKTIDNNRRNESIKFILLITGIAIIFFITHFWNYNTAPWNSNGLFDDAAWDIYFVQEFTESQAPLQIIFNDTQIGRVSRELVFHYYIGAWFFLVGYNLFVFNIALVFLGFITVLFTALLVFRIFKRYSYAALAAVLMNFFPFHYTQIFMGHRYAICVPLMMISIYFLYFGFQKKSMLKVCLGGVFAALCMESAIMGKQYIYALAGTAALYLIFTFKDKSKIKANLPLVIASAIAFLFTMVPLIAYILTNYKAYTIRESSLIADFFVRIKKEGLFAPLRENIILCYSTIFSPFSNQRQFMHSFPIIPYLYLPVIVLGTIMAFLKKHYYILLMIVIPLAGNIVTTSFDFRLLISAPFYILAIVFAFHWLASFVNSQKIQTAAIFIGAGILIFSPVRYLNDLSQDTNGQYLMPHKSVAASRLIQDIVVGEDKPSTDMKWDEFRRKNENNEYDTLAATRFSYAHVHAYLNDYDAYKILSLLKNFPYDGIDPRLLKGYFLTAVQDYKIQSKDIMIVLEIGPEISEILQILRKFEKKVIKEYNGNVDGAAIQIFTIRIANGDFMVFKDYISHELGVEIQ